MIAALILIIIAIVCLVFGIKGVKKKNAEKKAADEAYARAKAANTYEFVVAGILHRLDAVMSLAEEEDDYKLSVKKLDEQYPGEKVFKYWFRSLPCSITPEDNEYDPNALRIDVAGDAVGYIRKDDTAKVRAVLSGRFGSVESCSVKFEGGPYKLADVDDEGEPCLIKDEDPIYGTVEIKARPQDPRDVSPVILTAKDITL